MLYYSVNVVWSPEDNQFMATIPEFPNLTAFGDTDVEAMTEAKEIAEMMIESKQKHGENIPEPKVRKSYSGQTRLRLPKSLHESLVQEAEHENISLNQYIIYLLTQNFTTEHLLKDVRKNVVSPNIVLIKKPGETSDIAYCTREDVSPQRFLGGAPSETTWTKVQQ